MFRPVFTLLLVTLIAAFASEQTAAAPAPSRFAGAWTMEQIAPGGSSRQQGTLVIIQNGNTLSGVMRLNGADVPIANVRESDGIISFSAAAPENPRVTLNYSGAIRGNELGVASQDLGSGSYTLTAQRAGAQGPDTPAPAQTAEGKAATPETAAPSRAAPPATVASAAPSRQDLPPAASQARSGPALEGEWSAEQTTPDTNGPTAATLAFTREGNNLEGVLTAADQSLPLFDVRQNGASVSFSVVVPGMPYDRINYSGMLENDLLALQGVGERPGVYGLVATRQQLASAAAPPQAVDSNVPVPAALLGDWIAELTEAGSAASVSASLSFDGDKATMLVGSEQRPLYEVVQSGQQVSFTVIVPGTPYESVRYSGVLTENRMQLTSLDQGRGVSTLTARRAEEGAQGRSGAGSSVFASLAPPPAADVRVPSSELPMPSERLPEPADIPPSTLRDLPPNGLALTPPMGWSSRQKLGSRTNERAIRESVDGLVRSRLNLAGYTYVELGDGWQGVRNAKGELQANERFPDMRALADYIHSQEMKLGLTASAGPKSCNGFEGSYGHEEEDARTFAEWGVDYVVYDWCGAAGLHVTEGEMRAAAQKMAEALRATGRDIVFVISAHGLHNAEEWAAKAGANVWRTGPELGEDWHSVSLAGFAQDGKEAVSFAGAWNDPGLLQVGNSRMIPDESRMQLNLWAILAAPLMLGTDARLMSRDTVELLSNNEVIAVNQDALGRQGRRVSFDGDTQVWARPLADGSMAVAFFNTGPRVASVEVTWEELGVAGSYLVRDLWSHENLGIANDRYAVVLAGGSSMLLTFSR